MTDAVEVEARHCKRCGVPVMAIVGRQMTPGRMPNWIHDWSGYTIGTRPWCAFASGPLFDDQVDPAPAKEGD